MAALMITGAKVGAMIGPKRALTIGLVIYMCGSGTTAVAQSLPVLLFGWSLLEGIGAALILPAIVALVASNFPVERRALIGGYCTTYFSWRWVFAAEVVLGAAILLLSRRMSDAPVGKQPQHCRTRLFATRTATAASQRRLQMPSGCGSAFRPEISSNATAMIRSSFI